MTAGDGDPLVLPLPDFAASRGVSKALIYKFINQGRLYGAALRRAGRKTMIVVPIAEQQLAEFTDPAQSRGPALPGGDDPIYARERARKTAADAERAELELAVRRAELVSAAEVAKAQAELWGEVRDGILQAARDAAPAVARLTDEQDVERYLDNALRGAMAALSAKWAEGAPNG